MTSKKYSAGARREPRQDRNGRWFKPKAKSSSGKSLKPLSGVYGGRRITGRMDRWGARQGVIRRWGIRRR